jgi:hypothetical protein
MKRLMAVSSDQLDIDLIGLEVALFLSDIGVRIRAIRSRVKE